jgi:glucuronokinase
MIITKAYPRVGLAGNPSDGYNGKTLSVTFHNFCARIELETASQLELVPGISDRSTYEDIHEFLQSIDSQGYYGGLRLIKAALRMFFRHAQDIGRGLNRAPFRLSYHSDIPLHRGLAGSSAIITATLISLGRYYQIPLEPPLLANLALSAEQDELNIKAGLQDRVVQAFDSLVFMDFNSERLQQRGYGDYTVIDPDLLPPLYLAYHHQRGEESGITHRDLRSRYDAGEKTVMDTLDAIAACAKAAQTAVLTQSPNDLADAMNRNFDLRATLLPIDPHDQELIDRARSVGVSAKFPGSGGAIVGTYENEKMFAALRDRLEATGATVIKLNVTPQ